MAVADTGAKSCTPWRWHDTFCDLSWHCTGREWAQWPGILSSQEILWWPWDIISSGSIYMRDWHIQVSLCPGPKLERSERSEQVWSRQHCPHRRHVTNSVGFFCSLPAKCQFPFLMKRNQSTHAYLEKCLENMLNMLNNTYCGHQDIAICQSLYRL